MAICKKSRFTVVLGTCAGFTKFGISKEKSKLDGAFIVYIGLHRKMIIVTYFTRKDFKELS